MIQAVLLMLHVLIALALIVLILLQQGKGAEIGAAFGSGASQTFFGSRGASSFLLKLTAVLAACFFGTSLLLGHLSTQTTKEDHIQALAKFAKQLPPQTKEQAQGPAPTTHRAVPPPSLFNPNTQN